ncbi:MAG: type I restriction enzyme EcoKI subunit R [bacterium ADurb.Bin157]|nr:MAG: type I restriction enzyme EcoKI subunit R [bacterium ADurb.Bin157]
MAYFDSHYNDVKLVQSEPHQVLGFRNAQIGAIHAIAAHFTVEDRPAIAVLPTGSGKTAVLMASAFLLRAKRVLVITPSVLVRDQISHKFCELDPLKNIGALLPDIPCPKVLTVKSKLNSVDKWLELQKYDVIVSTPNCISTGFDNVCSPPDNIFDLILVDEAHHSPAITWQAILDQFPNSKKILVTATPFRHDRKELKGKFIYSYSIRQAHKDGIYGDIEYVPVPPSNIDEDVAIASKAEKVIKKERDSGRASVLLIRTDQKKRAKELLRIYEENTSLKVKCVDSSYSEKYVQTALSELENGQLDGVICVDMLGEGVDFPQLKVAALHRPHKSLEITLQFIGRFARTNDPNVKSAKFIAVPNDIKFEAERMYKDRSAWIELVSKLSEARIEQEQRVYNVLDGFKQTENLPVESGEISLYAFRPYFRVMVFNVNGTVDYQNGPSLPSNFNLIDKEINEEESTCIIVTSEDAYPLWTRHEYFMTTSYHLAVLYYHSESNLLFVYSSLKSDELCREFAKTVVHGAVTSVPLNEISKVLLDLNNLKFFNVGMRNRAHGNRQESYRILAGGNADQAVSEMDGHLYNQGHVFGKGEDNGINATIGYSSSSKIWVNQQFQIPNLIDKCADFAMKIMSDRDPKTYTQLDYLSKGRTVDQYPDDIAAIDWNYRVYQSLPRCIVVQDGYRDESNLLDFTIKLIKVDARIQYR